MKRYEARARASLIVPENGRVWEVLTSRGEHVVPGQELLRILDCSGAVVTAAVSEATYGSLRLGGAATFQLRGDGAIHDGRIIGMHGLAAAHANLAIPQTSLAREPYHVTVDVPALAGNGDCALGRTGKVSFKTGDQPTSIMGLARAWLP